jgi:hypothetical protein
MKRPFFIALSIHTVLVYGLVSSMPHHYAYEGRFIATHSATSCMGYRP